MNGMTIGELAQRAGVGVETVRYYQRRCLLAQPERPFRSYRRYGEDALRRLRFIRRAQELGFSLKEIRELLDLRVAPGTTCADVRGRAMATIARIEGKLRDLERMRAALNALAAACRGSGPAGECPILDALEQAEEGA